MEDRFLGRNTHTHTLLRYILYLRAALVKEKGNINTAQLVRYVRECIVNCYKSGPL